MRFFFLFCAALLFTQNLFSQKILFVDSSQTKVSFRGLCVITNQLLWVSGSGGTVGKSSDAGFSWQWMHPAGFENRDFRDIEAFDENTAIAMAVDRPAIIIKTTNGGKDWKLVYQKDIPGIFLDAMCFKNEKRGLCVGDPISQKFWIIETIDGGDSWQETPANMRPTADSGEACFASSGTNLQFVQDPRFEYGFVSGGADSKLYLQSSSSQKPNAIIGLTINKELESTGANSLAVYKNKYVIVGGDFKEPKLELYNSTYSLDAGKHWQSPTQTMAGYKSCVAWVNENSWIATGTSGTDISTKTLNTWKHISDIGFHVVQKAKKGNAVFLAGSKGRIGRYVQ